MKALVYKEIRENLKLVALGLLTYTVLLLVEYRQYVGSPSYMHQPLASDDLLWNTLWFCGIFGAVLGWLQIFNERRPDLWAFLLHRPLTRTEIFVGKTLAGLGLYAAVLGLPLAWFIGWALWPGHVAAPFELRMLRPLAGAILTGVAWYFAGMVTGLRQARWYGSRALALGMALIVCLLMQFRPVWWEGFLLVIAGAVVLMAAAWGGFQTGGYYRGQPMWGKAALIAALMLGCMIAAMAAAGLLSNLFPHRQETKSWSHYVMTKEGVVYKITSGPGEKTAIVDLEGKPLLDEKTGSELTLAEFNRRVEARSVGISLEEGVRWRLWSQKDMNLAYGVKATSDTLWYYWKRYGRLVGYDITTRRCIGSLGPNGFAQDLSGGGERFRDPRMQEIGRCLSTATALYRPDLGQRTVKPLFTTTGDDPIEPVLSIGFHAEASELGYWPVVTKRFVHLLTGDGQPVLKVPCDAKGTTYGLVLIYFLEPEGQFAVWLVPSNRQNERAGWTLPTRVLWLARDADVVRRADLPALRPPDHRLGMDEKLIYAVVPPAVLAMLPWIEAVVGESRLPRGLIQVSWAIAVLVCLPTGAWLGQRYRFSLGAQAGWGVFHVLFGVPGLLAFLAAQEWPAREACPNCKRLRLVDRAQCEHCGADFAPPEKTGTEVFAT